MGICITKPMPPTQGRAANNRYQVKRFGNESIAYEFLGKSDNALHWKIEKGLDIAAGVYMVQLSKEGKRFIKA
jgi:hypothetical protein